MPENSELNHSLMLDGRERLSITGVEDVRSFDDQTITALTSMGVLIVHGEELRIERLSLDMGELVVMGEVSALEYAEERERGGGLMRRLFG